MSPEAKQVLRWATYVWIFLALLAISGLLVLLFNRDLANASDFQLGDVIKGWSTAVLVPAYWVFVLLILLAERKWPAEPRPGSPLSSRAVDLIWLLAAPIFTLTIVAIYLGGLQWVYVHLLHSYSFDVEKYVGPVIAFILAFLLADLGMWFTHFVRHKVPLFWQFHLVHHSQERMGVLTDNRVHFIEAMVSATIVYLPLRLVGLDAQASVLIAYLTVFFTGFTHANLRTNLGPLRWILVTPQSHRVHHSDRPEHWDHNFGAILSIWDRMFGTQVRDADVYPMTGAGMADFPVETDATWAQAPGYYIRQVSYPFAKVWAMARG